MYFGMPCPTGRKNGLAFNALSAWNSKREPWIWLVPLLICTLIAEPPDIPSLASALAVTIETDSIASRPGT